MARIKKKPNVNYNLSTHFSTCHVTLSTTSRSCARVVAVKAADKLHCTVSCETFCSLNKKFLHNAHHLQITHACCVHDVKSAHKCATNTDTTPWMQSEAWSSVSLAQHVQRPNHLSTVGP